MQQFNDYVGAEVFQILDENKTTGHMKVRGVFQRSDVKNGNGRVYSEQLWNRVLGEGALKQTLGSRLMLGEVEHPSDGMTNLSRVSHVITSLNKSSGKVVGEAEVLNTPSGKILQELFRAKVPVGISSRGKGTSYSKGGVEYVNERDYILDTFDFVYKPSTPGAYTSIAESLDNPFKPDSSMKDRTLELKRTEVKVADILKESTSANLNQLRRFRDQLVEADAAIDSISMQTSEDEVTSYCSTLTEQVESARKNVDARLDEHYRSDAPTRTSHVHAYAESVKHNEFSDSPSNDAGTLTEAVERAGYWQGRADTLQRDFSASVELCEAIKEENDQRATQIESLTAELEESQVKLAKAESFIEAVVSKSEKAKMVKRVREAIEVNPKLARFKGILLRESTSKKLEATISHLEEAVGRPPELTPVIAEGLNEEESMTGSKNKSLPDGNAAPKDRSDYDHAGDKGMVKGGKMEDDDEEDEEGGEMSPEDDMDFGSGEDDDVEIDGDEEEPEMDFGDEEGGEAPDMDGEEEPDMGDEEGGEGEPEMDFGSDDDEEDEGDEEEADFNFGDDEEEPEEEGDDDMDFGSDDDEEDDDEEEDYESEDDFDFGEDDEEDEEDEDDEEDDKDEDYEDRRKSQEELPESVQDFNGSDSFFEDSKPEASSNGVLNENVTDRTLGVTRRMINRHSNWK